MTALFAVELLDGFQKGLSELTRGSVKAEIIEPMRIPSCRSVLFS